MGILKEIKKSILFMVLLSAIACNGNTNKLNLIDSLTGIKISNQLTFLQDKEEWNDFNGDGYRICIYKINDEYCSLLLEKLKKRGFMSFSEEHIDTIFNGRTGIYKSYQVDDDEIYTIYVDSANNELILMYEIL